MRWSSLVVGSECVVILRSRVVGERLMRERLLRRGVLRGGSAGVKLQLEGWASGGLLSERLVRNVVGCVGICGFERSCCW